MTPSANRLARVFPRRTKATPDDPLAFVGSPDLMDLAIADGVDEVHVSVAFTADKVIAERPAPEWRSFQRKWARPAIIHSMRAAQVVAEEVELEAGELCI